MRFRADCRQLADEVGDPAFQRHFLRMAEEWTILAEQGPEALSQAEMSATRH
jgi:hypothetical protein